jgi:hypothetical protein
VAAFLFAWNPRHRRPASLADDIRRLERKGRVQITWRSGMRRQLPVGSRAFLVRLGQEPRGIIGAGWTRTIPSGEPLGVDIEFETLNETPLIAFPRLLTRPFDAVHWTIQSSGVEIPDRVAAELDRLIRAGSGDGKRASERYAREVFERLWPRSVVRRAVAEFLADFIDRTQQSTTAWNVTLDPDSIRLNVGPVQLLSLRRDSIWFCATGGRQSWPSWVRDDSRRHWVYNAVKIPSRQYRVIPSKIADLPEQLRSACLEYVRAAAARRRGQPLWPHAHSKGVLDYLEHLFGRELPGAVREASKLRGDRSRVAYVEGARSQITLDRYERNRALRRRCLAEHGAACVVCGFDFGVVYGREAAGYIHVHHLDPLGDGRGAREVDAAKDLRPVCPNCHAVIHLGGGVRSVDEVKAMLQKTTAKY